MHYHSPVNLCILHDHPERYRSNMSAVFCLPYQFLRERYLTPYRERSSFVQQATPFQDFIIRCVRYTFAKIPANICRVFLSKDVALPFLRFRMWRYGIFRSPVHWREIKLVSLAMQAGLDFSLCSWSIDDSKEQCHWPLDCP